DFPNPFEVDRARVCARAYDDQLRFIVMRKGGELIVVNQLRIFIHPVGHDAIVLSGEIEGMTVREMTAVGKVHAQNRVAGLENGQIDGHVRLAAGMRLYVHMLRTEKLLRAVYREVFDDIYEFATSVVAASWVPFGILVREYRSRCLQDRAI